MRAMFAACWLPWAIALAFPFSARNEAAQGEKAPPAVICKPCKSTGWAACPEHPKEEAVWERGAQFCSFIADCATCKGAGFVDCAECENPTGDKLLAEKLAMLPTLRKECEGYDAAMGRPLRKGASKHFTLVWEIDSLKVEKRVLGAHELMHLYLDRFERQFDFYVEWLQARPGEIVKRQRIFVWWLASDQLNASLRFCQQGSQNGVKLMGSESSYSVCGNRQFFNGDERLHRNLVHSIAHLLFAHQTPSQWIGNIKGGWVDEGLAHVFEERLFGICDTYCYEEQNSNTDFKGGKYKVAVRKMVAEDKVPSVAEVIQRNTDQLKLPEHAVAMSLVDFLLTRDGKQFNLLGKQLRSKVGSREALAATFQWTPLELEREWKAWVLETYPKQ